MLPTIRFALALFLLILSPTLLSAQSYAVDRGSLLIGGTGGFSSSSSGGSDRASFLQLQPSIQYFVAPGFALGGDLLFHRLSHGDQSRTTYGVGPALSYYFGGSERRMYPFVSGSVQYYRSGDDNTLGYRAAGGAVAMLTAGVGLSGSLYYQQFEYEESDSSNTVGVALGIAAFVF